MKMIPRSRRERLIYIVVLLWCYFGVLGFLSKTSYSDLAVYFVSLTGFVGSYVWSETKRRSVSQPGYLFAPKSRREKIVHISVWAWFVLGNFAVFNHLSLIDLSAYFAALTPFVGAYVMGETFKPSSTIKVPTISKEDSDTSTDETDDKKEKKEDKDIDSANIIPEDQR